MRYLIASLFLGCFAVGGYSQDTTDVSTEVSSEVTVSDETPQSEDVAVSVDSHKSGCGCGGKPKI